MSSDPELSYGKYGNKQKILKATKEDSIIRVRIRNTVIRIRGSGFLPKGTYRIRITIKK
jgi:hypothetical protein